ncbi:MAG: divalent-cation tolerance protein CutA [Theionarchaea archaeon]|nr:divalent-cation tolerance protein CutA [Theionarchaea archaeon]
MEYSFIYFTCSSKEEAHTIGKTLVERRLVACVNIFNVSSMFIWKGTLEEAEEYAAFLKTEKRKVKETIEEVKRLHSYDVPDVVEIPLGEGYEPLFEWISEVVQ